MSRPTIHDVAEAAEVSLATVDRVLNNRGGVAEKSVKRVKEAVARTGYVRDQAAAMMSRRADVPLTFVLPEGPSDFLDNLRAGLQREKDRLQSERIIFEERTSKAFDSESTAAAMEACATQSGGAVAVMAPDTPQVRRAVSTLIDRGIHVVTMVADLPGSGRAVYAGIDNLQAGRTAAQFMGRMIHDPNGRIQVIAGSMAARDHAERLMGFHQVMPRDFPQFEVLPVLEGYDDAARVKELAQAALETHPVGIYAIGAGNRGLAAALANHRGCRPFTLVHELTPTSRAALYDDIFDLVIDQDPARIARRAITLMRDLVSERTVAERDGEIPPNIHMKENTP